MKANAKNSSFILPLILLVLAFITSLLPIISTLNPPVINRVGYEQFVSKGMPYNLAAQDTQDFIPVRDFKMTQQPPECRGLGIFGCKAYPSENLMGDDHIVDLTIRMGKKKLGQIQMMEIPSTYAAELEPALAFSDTCYIESVAVRQFLWNNGFGRWLFTQGNNLLRLIAAKEGRDVVVRVLVDQTGKAANWLDTIPSEDIVSAVDGVYIFLLHP
jgi:hypothetical protein